MFLMEGRKKSNEALARLEDWAVRASRQIPVCVQSLEMHECKGYKIKLQ
jgi:hypothetical protein